jgi:hypothetical protein
MAGWDPSFKVSARLWQLTLHERRRHLTLNLHSTPYFVIPYTSSSIRQLASARPTAEYFHTLDALFVAILDSIWYRQRISISFGFLIYSSRDAGRHIYATPVKAESFLR